MNRLSIKSLKWITTILIVVPLFMMLGAPWILRHPHRMLPRIYIRRVGTYGFILALSAIGSGVGAFTVLRREKEAYREKAMENLKALDDAIRQAQLAKSKRSTHGQPNE